MRSVPERDLEPPGGGRFDEAGDATRRTHLANERTYLAWWRSGLTCLAVSFGTGKVVPNLSHETRWPYAVLGSGFAILGLVFIAYGFMRQRAVEAAVMKGEFQRPDDRLIAWVTVFGVLLGGGVLALVIFAT
jgi:putative membrane protein